MALQLRRGLDTDRIRIKFAPGELVYTTDTKKLYVGDGTTLGGSEVSLNDSDITAAVAGAQAPVIQAVVNKEYVDNLNINAVELDGYGRAYYRNYNNLTNTPTILDSADVNSLIAATSTDSNNITNLILSTVDTDYTQSIIGNTSIGTLSDVDLTDIAADRILKWDGSKFVAASAASGGTGIQLSDLSVIDSSQYGFLTYSSLTGEFNFQSITDSDILSLVDSAYVQARQSVFDSNDVTSIVDSAYIQARQIRLDSAEVVDLIDSAYVQARQIKLDSAEVISLIDSDYVQSRVTFSDDLDSAKVAAIANDRIDILALDSQEVLGIIAATDTHDSVAVAGQITSTVTSSYIQSRQTTYDFETDYAPLIDSDFIQSRRPAETIITVGNNGSVGYTFTGDGFPSTSGDNPTIYLQRGLQYKFEVSASGHPFYIKTNQSTGTGSQYTSGVVNNGAQDGTIYFTVPMDAPERLYYNCQYHSSMNGTFVINTTGGVDSAAVSDIVDNLTSLNVQSIIADSVRFTDTGKAVFGTDDDLQIYHDGSNSYIIHNGDGVLLNQTDGFYVRDAAGVKTGFVSTPNGATTLYYDNNAKVATASTGITVTGTMSADSAVIGGNRVLTTADDTHDSVAVFGQIDSAYIQERQTHYLDSAEVSSVILTDVDSAYVQARVVLDDAGIDSATASAIADARIAVADTHDSAAVQSQITSTVDAAYVQARQITYDFLDSTEALSLIDTTYVRGKIDQAFIDTFDTHDSVAIQNQITSTVTESYVKNFADSAHVRSALSGGTGVTFNGSTGEISIGQDVGTSDNVSFANLNITGDLNVTGTQTTVTSQTLAITDPLIRLAESNEQTDIIDIGFIGHYYGEGSRRHTGFFRDASNKEYYIFNGLIDSAFDSSPPTNIVDRTKPGFTLATLNTGRIVGVYAGFDSDLGTKSTSDLSEGTNLYYTKVRVDSDIALKVDQTFVDNLAINYSSLTGTPVFGSGLTDQSGTIIIGPDQVKATMIDFGTGANQVSTDDVVEGSSNLYYTDAKVATYVDSAYVQGKINQEFINTFDTHDSVAIQNMINATIAATDTHDSTAIVNQIRDYVNTNIDQTFIDGFDTHDSTAIANQARDVINTNVTQGYINSLNIDAGTLDGQDGTYYLNYNNLTNAPTVLDSLNITSIINETDTHDSVAVQGQINSNFASGFSAGAITATSFSGDGSALTNVSAAKGGSTDQVFYENDQTVTTNYTITTNKNAMTAGPITINSGVTVTIPTGSEWSIV